MAGARRRWISAIVAPVTAVAVLFLGGWQGAWAAATEGGPLPNFQLPKAETGETVDPVALLQGAVGAVVFMQTSCRACREELTELRNLQGRFPDLRVVVISVDSGSPDRVNRYREHFGFEFPFLHDPDFKSPELFGFSFTPALVLVGKDGKIALLKGGFRPGDEKEIEKKVAALTAR